MASFRWAGRMGSLWSRSAMVRATRRTLSCGASGKAHVAHRGAEDVLALAVERQNWRVWRCVMSEL